MSDDVNSYDPNLVTDFLLATDVRASPMYVIDSEGGEQVVMIEFEGTLGGPDGEEILARIVVTEESAREMRANLDWTIEKWGEWARGDRP